jgi:hypothetical protein
MIAVVPPVAADSAVWSTVCPALLKGLMPNGALAAFTHAAIGGAVTVMGTVLPRFASAVDFPTASQTEAPAASVVVTVEPVPPQAEVPQASTDAEESHALRSAMLAAPDVGQVWKV